MKKPWPCLAFAAVILLVYPAIGAASESIVGEWLALDRTKDGIGIAKTYAKNGSVQVSSGPLIDYRYNLVGKKLVLSSPPKEATVLYVEIKGSKLILTDIAGNQQKLTRISGDGKSGIIGKWTGDHHTGRQQIMHFTVGRNCYVSVPIVSEKGSYSIKGDNLTEVYKFKGTEKWQWAIHSNVLTITSQTKDKSEKYRRKE